MTTLTQQINYIKLHIDEISKSDRQAILDEIIQAKVSMKKLEVKGGGTQIAFKEIPENIIRSIYQRIETIVCRKLSELDSFVDKT